MPILADEPSLYPDDLFADSAPISSGCQAWALHTKPRQEKCLARLLHKAQVPFFLPLVERRARVRGRERSSYIPLFPGYVFLFGSDEQRAQTLTGNRIVQTLAVADVAQLWADLAQIRRLIEAHATFTLEDRLDTGARVRIKTGPLMGLAGTVLARRGQSRLLVAVQFLQQGVSLEVEDCVLERVDH